MERHQHSTRFQQVPTCPSRLKARHLGGAFHDQSRGHVQSLRQRAQSWRTASLATCCAECVASPPCVLLRHMGCSHGFSCLWLPDGWIRTPGASAGGWGGRGGRRWALHPPAASLWGYPGLTEGHAAFTVTLSPHPPSGAEVSPVPPHPFPCRVVLQVLPLLLDSPVVLNTLLTPLKSFVVKLFSDRSVPCRDLRCGDSPGLLTVPAAGEVPPLTPDGSREEWGPGVCFYHQTCFLIQGHR